MIIRKPLAVLLSVFAFSIAGATALVQVENYELAAALDALEEDSEWNARRASGLTSEVERFDFDLEAQQTRGEGSARTSASW